MWNTADLMRCKLYKDDTCTSSKGKFGQAICTPDARQVAGFYLKRSDILLMFKRPELFVALDKLGKKEAGFYLKSLDQALGKKAIERLSLDWENCIILQGMDVITEAGEPCGFVDSIIFDPQNGKITSVGLKSSLSSRILLGTHEISVNYVLACKQGHLVVKNEVAELASSGGIAQKAGHLVAKTSHKAQQFSAKSKEALSQVEEGASVKIGKQLKDAKGMFAAFKEEFDKASKD